MKSLKFLAVALAAAMLVVPASAETIKRQGGRAVTDRIGPWYIVKTSFEDGSRVCFAHNLSYGRSLPLFSVLSVIGGSQPGPWAQYQAIGPVSDNETVTVTIGDATFKFMHEPSDADPLFGPRSTKEVQQIIEALRDGEKSGKKVFFVVDKTGKPQKFDLRSTDKMLAYMERNCGFELK